MNDIHIHLPTLIIYVGPNGGFCITGILYERHATNMVKGEYSSN